MVVHQAIREVEVQPTLQPGEEGWWKVWGATPYHIQAGDIVITSTETFYVEDVYEPKSAPVRVGIVVDGEQSTIGAGCPIRLLRRGTKNTLA